MWSPSRIERACSGFSTRDRAAGCLQFPVVTFFTIPHRPVCSSCSRSSAQHPCCLSPVSHLIYSSPILSLSASLATCFSTSRTSTPVSAPRLLRRPQKYQPSGSTRVVSRIGWCAQSEKSRRTNVISIYCSSNITSPLYRSTLEYTTGLKTQSQSQSP